MTLTGFGESNGEEGCEFVCKKLGASLREISGNKRIFEGNWIHFTATYEHQQWEYSGYGPASLFCVAAKIGFVTLHVFISSHVT